VMESIEENGRLMPNLPDPQAVTIAEQMVPFWLLDQPGLRGTMEGIRRDIASALTAFAAERERAVWEEASMRAHEQRTNCKVPDASENFKTGWFASGQCLENEFRRRAQGMP